MIGLEYKSIKISLDIELIF
jgi:hypothetical protein